MKVSFRMEIVYEGRTDIVKLLPMSSREHNEEWTRRPTPPPSAESRSTGDNSCSFNFQLNAPTFQVFELIFN